MNLGFVGLGLMGSAMSGNLLKKSGCPVYVYDVSPAACEYMETQGAVVMPSCAALGEKCDVIFSMLPKNEHVAAVYEEMLPCAKPGTLFVDMSTISPEVSRGLSVRVAEFGCEMVDAPVVKSRPAALKGELGIYVGGSEQAFARVKPLLEYLGSNVIHMGGNGTALIMKLCHNALVAQIQNGVNETMKLAQATAGIDPRTYAKAISYGGGQNFYLDSKVEVIAESDFTTAFSVLNMNKDVHLTQDLCREKGLHLAGVELTCQRYEEAMKRGYGNEDFSATCKLFRD